MSQPKRLTLKGFSFGSGNEVENSEWVSASDYAALAAENEALVQQGIRDHGDWRSKLNFLEADYKAEVARLTAEKERLRKVGFRLAERLSWCGNLGDEPLIQEWQELTGTDVYKDKEGRDAK